MKENALPKSGKATGLEIETDPAFQRRSWQIERLAWALTFGLMLAALAGLFGDGWLSHAEVFEANGALHVKYERWARYSRLMQLQLRVPAASAGETGFWLNRSFLDQTRVEFISPPPDRVETSAERQTYFFQVAPAGTTLQVRFYLTPTHVGSLHGAAGTTTGAPVNFRSFIYP